MSFMTRGRHSLVDLRIKDGIQTSQASFESTTDEHLQVLGSFVTGLLRAPVAWNHAFASPNTELGHFWIQKWNGCLLVTIPETLTILTHQTRLVKLAKGLARLHDAMLVVYGQRRFRFAIVNWLRNRVEKLALANLVVLGQAIVDAVGIFPFRYFEANRDDALELWQEDLDPSYRIYWHVGCGLWFCSFLSNLCNLFHFFLNTGFTKLGQQEQKIRVL